MSKHRFHQIFPAEKNQSEHALEYASDVGSEDEEKTHYWGSIHAGTVSTTVEPRLRYQTEFAHVKCIIYPDDTLYGYWGYVIVLLLMYTALVTPYAIALLDIDTFEWFVIDLIVDSCFLLDVIINCFLAFHDQERELVTSHRVIFMHYLRGWMIIDILSCLPFQLILSTSKDYSSLARVARLPRLYRLIKMTKLARMLKLVKHMKKRRRNINSVGKVSIGMERLIWFAITFFLMTHLIACLWIMMGQFQETEADNWIFYYGFLDMDTFGMYMVSCYWTITTLTTVGYGDIGPQNTGERIFCSMIMIIGVFLYSYTIGSLSSLLSNLDQRQECLNKKLELLQELTAEYNLSKAFTTSLHTSLEFDHRQSRIEIQELLDSLPTLLRNKLLIVIYERQIKNNIFFKNKSTGFVAHVAPLLKPACMQAGDIIYKEGEQMQEMYFIIKGQAEFVIIKEFKSIPYLTIEENHYFGEVDFLFSTSKTHMDTAKAQIKCDLLCLTYANFENMCTTFQETSQEIMQLAKERYDRNSWLKRKAQRNTRTTRVGTRKSTIPQTLGDKKKKTLFDSVLTNEVARQTEIRRKGASNTSMNMTEISMDDEESNTGVEDENERRTSFTERKPAPTLELFTNTWAQSLRKKSLNRQQSLYDVIKSGQTSPETSPKPLNGVFNWGQVIQSNNKSRSQPPRILEPVSPQSVYSNGKTDSEIKVLKRDVYEIKYLVHRLCEKLDVSTEVPPQMTEKSLIELQQVPSHPADEEMPQPQLIRRYTTDVNSPDLKSLLSDNMHIIGQDPEESVASDTGKSQDEDLIIRQVSSLPESKTMPSGRPNTQNDVQYKFKMTEINLKQRLLDLERELKELRSQAQRPKQLPPGQIHMKKISSIPGDITASPNQSCNHSYADSRDFATAATPDSLATLGSIAINTGSPSNVSTYSRLTQNPTESDTTDLDNQGIESLQWEVQRLKEQKIKQTREQEVAYLQLKNENDMLKSDLSSKYHETIDLKRQLARLKVDVRFESQLKEQNNETQMELQTVVDQIEEIKSYRCRDQGDSQDPFMQSYCPDMRPESNIRQLRNTKRQNI